MVILKFFWIFRSKLKPLESETLKVTPCVVGTGEVNGRCVMGLNGEYTLLWRPTHRSETGMEGVCVGETVGTPDPVPKSWSRGNCKTRGSDK